MMEKGDSLEGYKNRESRQGYRNRKLTYYPLAAVYEGEVKGFMMQRGGKRYLFNGTEFMMIDPVHSELSDTMSLLQVEDFLNRVRVQVRRKRKFRAALDRLIKLAQTQFKYLKEEEAVLYDPQQSDIGSDR